MAKNNDRNQNSQEQNAQDTAITISTSINESIEVNESDNSDNTDMTISTTSTIQQQEKSTLQPHVPAQADQLQEWKTWLSANDGQILAAMLRTIPTPVTRRINWGEFVELFGLNFDPAENLAKELETLTATFPEWVRKFNYSYMAVTNATARVNFESDKFNRGLANVAEQLTKTATNGNQVVAESPFHNLFS